MAKVDGTDEALTIFALVVFQIALFIVVPLYMS
jgi:hypothetical protein